MEVAKAIHLTLAEIKGKILSILPFHEENQVIKRNYGKIDKDKSDKFIGFYFQSVAIYCKILRYQDITTSSFQPKRCPLGTMAPISWPRRVRFHMPVKTLRKTDKITCTLTHWHHVYWTHSKSAESAQAKLQKWHGNGDEKDVSTKNSILINFDKSLTPMISSSGIPDTPYSQIGDH